MKHPILTMLLALNAAVFSSCSEDEPNTIPLKTGSSVEIRNTLQIASDPSSGGTGGAEVPVETVFGAPEGAYELTTEIDASVEFERYLEGLYDIDISESVIAFSLVASDDHPIYKDFFRTIEAGTFDRYYLRFPDGHNITSFSSNSSFVTLEVSNDKEIIVIIGEGWGFNPGSSFEISLN